MLGCGYAGQAADLQTLLFGGAGAGEPDHDDGVMDAYSDEFYMYEFKVRRCRRGRTHDWTQCDFAHPGETARRRDPRQHPYIAAVCLDFRWSGACPRGDACPLAHGVFEYWLHPSRYRTLLCRDGPGCNRQVCFFAHTPAQLRVIPPPQQPLPPLGSPHHHLARDAALQKMLRRRRFPTAAAPSAALMDPSPLLSMYPPCSGGSREPSDCESDLLEQPPPALLDEMQPPVWLEEMLSQIFA